MRLRCNHPGQDASGFQTVKWRGYSKARWSVVGKDGMRALKEFNSWLSGGLLKKSNATRLDEP